MSPNGYYTEKHFSLQPGMDRGIFEKRAIKIYDDLKKPENNKLVIPAVSTMELQSSYQLINHHLKKNASDFDKTINFESEEIIFLKVLFFQKISWSDIGSFIAELTPHEGKLFRSLNIREHAAFDRAFPEAHFHSEVVSFGSQVGHNVPLLGPLGIRSFVNEKNQRQLNTCFLKNEVFKNVFIPLTLFFPELGR